MKSADLTTPRVNPCIVIPVYNHSRGLASMTAELVRSQLPCLVVDDGSDEMSALALDALVTQTPQMTLLRRSANGGKGAAVCDALKAAHKRGFSHALQVDADGQHDLGDIPKFLQACHESPHAVITGVRLYGSVPAARRYGRYITDFWVWINTLSFTISDSMCGYRLYPVAETVQMLNHAQVGRRMDFDTDILVRLYWQGLSIRQIQSKVTYSDDITSHFDLWKDNLRISAMHARLFFGMLPRFPRLLWRSFMGRNVK